MKGGAAVVHGGTECQNLDGSDAGLRVEAAHNAFWVRVHADEVTGREFLPQPATIVPSPAAA